MYSERFTSLFSFHPHSTPATTVWRDDKMYDLWPPVMDGYCLRGKRNELQKTGTVYSQINIYLQ